MPRSFPSSPHEVCNIIPRMRLPTACINYCQIQHQRCPQCLKISEKVAFIIASEASYVYILSGQKLIKNAKNSQSWRLFENLMLAVKQCYQTGHFKQDKNWWKMPKLKISNETFWVIFKHCVLSPYSMISLLSLKDKKIVDSKI